MDVWLGLQIVGASLLGAALVGAWQGWAAGALGQADMVGLPVWAVDGAGRIVWRNAACRALGAALPDRVGRTELSGRWFEVSNRAQPLRRGPSLSVFTAMPVDGLVQAETAMVELRNTMSVTFAYLDQGLGLFDSGGRLQMFNPALVDLTGLPVEFLARKPDLGALLDALRDRAMLPEPKDWRAWREAMLNQTLSPRPHEETWALPGGVTYRATLRPQARGAFALLVEDISPEMTRSQRSRAEMELAQAVIDTVDDGIAVFAQTGQLVLTNTAYSRVWGHDPGSDIDEGSLRRIVAHWRDHSAPSTLWTRIEDFIAQPGERQAWQAEARLRDGRMVTCHLAPIWDGATLAAFRPVQPEKALRNGAMRPDPHRPRRIAG